MSLFSNPLGSQIVTGTPESVAARYAGLEQQAGESLRDYYTRLRATREGGILGTSGLPPAMPKEESKAEQAVEELTCPDGYVLKDGACVPAGGDGESMDMEAALPTVRWEAGDDPFGTGLNYGGYTTGLKGGQGMTGDLPVDVGFGLMNYGGKIVGALTNPLLGKLVEGAGGMILDSEIDKRAASIDALTPNINDPAYANPAGFDENAVTVSDKYGNVRTLTGSQVAADLDLIRNTTPSGTIQSGLFDSNAFGNANEAKAVLEFGLGSDAQFDAIDKQFASLPITTGSTKTSTVNDVLSTPTAYYQPATTYAAPQYMDFNFGTSGLDAEEQALSQSLAQGSDAAAYNSGLLSDEAAITQVAQDAFEQAIAEDTANRSSTSSSTSSSNSGSSNPTAASVGTTVSDRYGNAISDGTGGYVQGRPSSSSSSSSSGSSGGGKIVCTAMNERYGFGSYRNAIWLKYSADHMTKEHEVGYHAMFLPLVDYGFKQGDGITHRIVRKALEHIARHRTTDIRAEMKGRKRDALGRVYRAVLEPLCYVVGKIKS
jgi:hypothetical protein